MSIYGILTKKFVNKYFVFFYLSYSLVCVSLIRLAVIKQHIWTPFSAVPLFLFGNVLMEPFVIFIGHAAHVFIGKNNEM